MFFSYHQVANFILELLKLNKNSENLFYFDYSVDFYSRKEYDVEKRKTSKGTKSMTFANMTVLLLRNEG